MKKLAALLVAAALISPVFAEETNKAEAPKVEKKVEKKAEKKVEPKKEEKKAEKKEEAKK